MYIPYTSFSEIFLTFYLLFQQQKTLAWTCGVTALTPGNLFFLFAGMRGDYCIDNLKIILGSPGE